MMKVPVVVSSLEDIASTSIKTVMLERGGWTSPGGEGYPEFRRSTRTSALMVTIQEPLVRSDNLDSYCHAEGIDPACYIFASRHRSAAGQPALLAHVPGNWGPEADLGGEPRKVAIASAMLVRMAFLGLLREKERHPAELARFSINIEVTHHGPTSLKHPLVFVELGSQESDWHDQDGASAVATAIESMLDTLHEQKNDLHALAKKEVKGIGIGFGGPHYAATFDRVIATTPVAFSHIVPKHAIEHLTKETIELAVNNTHEGVDWFVLDWKGLNKEQKDVLMPLLGQFPAIPVKRTKDLERDP